MRHCLQVILLCRCAVESSREDHRRQAELLLDLVLAARRTQTVESTQSTDATTDRVPTDPHRIQDAIDRAVDNELLPSEAELDHAKKMVAPDRDLSDAVPHAPDRTFRIGVAGPPGAGKSTFIEAMGMHLVRLGFRVGVLAIGACLYSMLVTTSILLWNACSTPGSFSPFPVQTHPRRAREGPSSATLLG